MREKKGEGRLSEVCLDQEEEEKKKRSEKY